MFNSVFSNGDKSGQVDMKYPSSCIFLLPQEGRVKTVEIEYGAHILGFSFFDQDRRTIFKIGRKGVKALTVELADKEVIIGVVAKSWGETKCVYTDLQLQISSLE